MDSPSPPLRKRSLEERRQWLLDELPLTGEERTFFGQQQLDRGLADRLIENCVGWFEVPLGIVSGLVVNGRSFEVPLATEEPSVLAAAGYAARLIAKSGGFQASAAEPLMRAQVFLEHAAPDAEARLQKQRAHIEAEARKHLESMERRGGGLRDVGLTRLPESGTTLVFFDVDVRDAMGANLLNTLAEAMAPILEQLLGGKRLLAILSNDASLRPATASFRLDAASLAKPGFSGVEMARRIVAAGQLAQTVPQRAVTHNKGIMNGVSALALATGNDTRALEAGVHSFAAATGVYKGLSSYSVEGGFLVGKITIPLALATVGGTTVVHPTARLALKILGAATSMELCCVAAALGLAQNFAALFALTGEGIQRGHMALHARRGTDTPAS